MKKIILSMTAALLALTPAASAQTVTLNASAYSIYNVTATGTQARVGIVAVSRDMLKTFPYGSRVKVVSSRGCGINLVGRVYRVEDTMARYKTRSVDVFMSTRSTAFKFGRCSMTLRRI